MNKPTFAETLARMTEDFARQLPQRLAAIEQAWAACCAAPGDDDALADLRRSLHTLAGTAGTFGRHDVGDRARALEHQVAALLARADRGAPDLQALGPGVRALGTGEAA